MSGRERTTSGRLVAVQVFAVFLLALVIRWVGIDQEPMNDELFHFLAARSWLTDGDFTILTGADPYDRVRPFTLVVAWLMGMFGTTLEVARSPAVVTGAALPALITWWLARNGMSVAGVLAGVLIALDPQLIQLSQVSRFYAPQNLAFVAGSLAVGASLARGTERRARLPTGLVGVVLLAVAVRLQIISLIGIAGLGLYAVAGAGSWMRQRLVPVATRHPVASGLAVLLLFGGGVWGLSLVGLTEYLTYSDLWAAGNRDNVRFYYAALHDSYAGPVVLFPLLAFLAWLRGPRIASLSLAVFGVAFTIHSLLAWKAERYLSYALPFFFILAAIGAVEGLRQLYRVTPKLLRSHGLERAGGRVVAIGLVATMALALAVGNRAILVTSRLLTRDPALHFPLVGSNEAPISWSRAAPELGRHAQGADFLVSSSALKAVYFLDRLDYIINLNSLVVAGGRRDEFWVDPRFDRPVLSRPESLELIRCEGSIVVVVEALRLSDPRLFPPALARYLGAEGTRLDLPGGAGLEAYRLSRRDGPGCGAESVPG